MSSLVILAASFLRYRADKQTNSGKNHTPVVVGNNIHAIYIQVHSHLANAVIKPENDIV